MAKIIHSNKPLSVNPLRVSQPMGAALAFLGLAQSLPLQHGAQGCTAFSKVFFTNHFREPIPLQTTALDMVSTIMGSDERLEEALETLIVEHQPAVIGLLTTGLAEMQGCDVNRVLQHFKAHHKASPCIIPVNTPDTLGGLESGYALAVSAIIDTLVPASQPGMERDDRQVNVLASAMLTPADIEAIAEWIESFGLQPVILPNLADSLDGHLSEEGYTCLTAGGTPQRQITVMGRSCCTLVIGESMGVAADTLQARTGVPDERFSGLSSLAECDRFIQVLADLSGQPVAARIQRQRRQLLDALVDCYVPLGEARIAVAADADVLSALSACLADCGASLVCAVTPVATEGLTQLPVAHVVVGDFADLEQQARQTDAQILIANAHGAQSAERLGIPLVRAGFPQFDHYGAAARQWVGYRGARQLIFELANWLRQSRQSISPHHSPLRQTFAEDASSDNPFIFSSGSLNS